MTMTGKIRHIAPPLLAFVHPSLGIFFWIEMYTELFNAEFLNLPPYIIISRLIQQASEWQFQSTLHYLKGHILELPEFNYFRVAQ